MLSAALSTYRLLLRSLGCTLCAIPTEKPYESYEYHDHTSYIAYRSSEMEGALADHQESGANQRHKEGRYQRHDKGLVLLDKIYRQRP